MGSKRKVELDSFFPQEEEIDQDFDVNTFMSNQENIRSEVLHTLKVEKKKKKAIRLEYLMVILISYITMCSTLFMPFLYVQSIQVEGASMYQEDTIKKALSLPNNVPIHILSMSALEARIQSLPLLESVNVWKGKGRTLQISIVEEMVLAYTIEEQAMFLLPDGRSVEITEEQLDYISKLPYLHGLNDELKIRFAKEIKDVSQEVLRTISEIMPYPTSYDPNMLQLITNEGLMIRTSMSSLFLLEEYRNVLYSLENREHCLYLDGINLAIVSQACEDELVIE